jgi:hypothetical protein
LFLPGVVLVVSLVFWFTDLPFIYLSTDPRRKRLGIWRKVCIKRWSFCFMASVLLSFIIYRTDCLWFLVPLTGGLRSVIQLFDSFELFKVPLMVLTLF